MPQDEAPDGVNKLFNINGLDLPVPLGLQITNLQTTLTLWNSKINITKNDSGERFLIENVLDPILACENYAVFDRNYLTLLSGGPNQLNLIDLGCGGGFVGLLWTIWLKKLYPTLLVKSVLFDSLRKRISFCAEVVRQLGLTDSITCVQGRAEAPDPGLVGTFDLVLSRATWAFDEFVAHATPFAKPGGKLISFEGPSGLAALKNTGATVLEYGVLPTIHPRFLGVLRGPTGSPA